MSPAVALCGFIFCCAIAGMVWLTKDIQAFGRGIGEWTSDDAKAADVGTGGVGASIERPSEHNRTS